jgi:hypothetical protein
MPGDERSANYARIYRTLHGSPMLAGVPAHLALALLATACLGGFGLMMVSNLAGLLVVVGVAGAWAVIGFVYSQDRVAMSMFALRRLYRFLPVVTSYTRSNVRVELVDSDPPGGGGKY